MGRPERHDVDYFPFFVKSGKTLDFLELKYGPEGTGYFTNILRFLSQTPDHYYCIKEETEKMVFLSRIKTTDEKKTIDIIEIMVKTGKLDKELWEKHRVIASEAFLESLTEAYRLRNNQIITIGEIRAKFENPQGDVVTNVGNEVNNVGNTHTSGFPSEIQEDNPQSKVKKSKVNIMSSACAEDQKEIIPVSPQETKIAPVSRSPPEKYDKGLTEDQKPLFHAAKACFEMYEKTKAIMYQDRGSAQMHMKNLKLFVGRCQNLAPGITADFMQAVLDHFKVLLGGKLKGKAEFTPRALMTPWIWEMVLGSLSENNLTDEMRESIKEMFK